MKVSARNLDLKFSETKLIFSGFNIDNIFARKNNKTLRETLDSTKYQNLSKKVSIFYSESLDEKLGVFLLKLKENNDMFYLKFLNPYGDKKYCNFKVERNNQQKGVYCFKLGKEIKYFGKTIDSFSNRINNGYGKISPQKCYLDGQSTNCRINSNINSLRKYIDINNLSFLICPIADNINIYDFEKQLIEIYKPNWNIQL